MSTEPREHREYDELRGEGWSRLLAAARRRLERTGGVLDGDIGLARPARPNAAPSSASPAVTGPRPPSASPYPCATWTGICTTATAPVCWRPSAGSTAHCATGRPNGPTRTRAANKP
ncbi:hypothetical protein O1M63_18170 [Streptomyces mirabilis]|nr:hypothetical protein [Streptomyces mirabilis]